ncbi:unnamed protein product [Prunus armeniaca]|uniref:CRIB domain-containing protein n=1 Tax=Prunus armeniaca TaxID=36596 RepID=A0A6J5WK42_PRUAR|nr:unnamed protein product [Prunus armeniaca]
MARLFRSKSCHLVGLTEFNIAPPSPFSHHHNNKDVDGEDEEEEEEMEELEYEDLGYEDEVQNNPMSTPFLYPTSRAHASNKGRDFHAHNGHQQQNQFAVLDILVAALRKSLITCSVERDDVASSIDISSPTEVRHVSHVTFDRFNGFLGLPTELEPEGPQEGA